MSRFWLKMKNPPSSPQQLKIISDGTIDGTKIFNADGSKFEPPVEKITIEMDVNSGLVKANMVVLNVELEMQMATEIELKDLE